MHAQNGAITGTVMDKQGAVVPGAKVVVLDQIRAGQRNMNSTTEGLFLFDSLSPSTYLLTVEAPGFKKWEKKNIQLYAGDRLGVNDIVLEVGQLNETVTVEASAATLQTESAKVESTVTSQQMTEISNFNRNFMLMLRTIPGVDTLTSASMYININGQRNDQAGYKLDGAVNMSFGNQMCCIAPPTPDMVAEVKMVTNGATADMGATGSSEVMVVTKSGTKEFHGNLYYYRRHESMNANSWTNKINNVAKSRDRMNQGGFTLGGPLYIPKHFNTSKDKLFFFVSTELAKSVTPSVTQVTVPTQAERNGDFSQSIRMSDKSAVVLLDPTNLVNNVRQPVPGNQISSLLWSPDARKLMNVMPLPNLTDLTGIQYNYRRVNSSGYKDSLSRSYKLDYNHSDRWRFYGRFTHSNSESSAPTGMGSFEVDSAGQTLGWGETGYGADKSLVLNATTIITPTTTNELILSGSKRVGHFVVLNPAYTRTKLGLTSTLPNMSVLRNDYAPLVSLGGGGLSNAPSLGSNLPYMYSNPDYQITDNFTKVFSRHTLKVGGVYQRDRNDQDRLPGVPTAGSFNFTVDSVNPGDYDYSYANMLAGGFNTFTQAKGDPEGRFVFNQAEWYVMDTYKLKPNLTLDLGLRFSLYMGGTYYDTKGQSVTFSRELWNPTKVVKLYGYASGGMAVDPTTGLLYPGILRGQIVPGSGNIDNGFTIIGQNGTPPHLMPDQPVMLNPRLGIAWQPKFLPKTVIRVGGGVFHSRVGGNLGVDSVAAPPTTRDTVLRYGNMSAVSSALYNVISPPGVSTRGYTGSGKIPETINWNFAIERELPSAVLLTASYVGSISRNQPYANVMNEPYYGAAWLAANQDPTVTAKFNGTTTLPINFYRPYIGIGSLNLYATGSSSNYNALQVQVQKRMSRKLSYGIAYTWSKVLGVGDSAGAAANAFDARKYNYARLSFDHTQVLAANFIYYLPKFGKNRNLLDIPGVRLVLNDWQLSGIVIATTGSPTQFGYPSYTNDGTNISQRWTGQPDLGPRPYIVGDWRLASGKDDYHQFNTSVVQPAIIPSVGLESGLGYLSQPTTFWSSPEITMMKNVPFSKDGRRYVQLRLETFNALNHHDYNGRAMTPNFWSPTDVRITNLPTGVSTMVNPSTGAALDGGRFGYGALTGAQSPRVVQIAMKIYF
jgi:hypothetical protein